MSRRHVRHGAGISFRGVPGALSTLTLEIAVPRLLPLALAAALAAIAGPAFAAPTHDHAAPPHTATTALPAAAEGEVRKVDAAKGKVVLKHGPLAALDMPAMTMEFTAKDPKLLANVKVGDKVRFTPAQAKDGTLIVTGIEPVRN